MPAAEAATARERAIDTAKIAGIEPPDPEPLPAEARYPVGAWQEGRWNSEHLWPMLQHIAANTGAFPNVLMLDAGYWWEDDTNCSSGLGIDAYIASGRLPHKQSPQPRRNPMPR